MLISNTKLTLNMQLKKDYAMIKYLAIGHILIVGKITQI